MPEPTTEITPDIFRRAVVVAEPVTDGDGCATVEVVLDGRVDVDGITPLEETVTVELEPTNPAPPSEAETITVGIPDVENHSPGVFKLPATCAGEVESIRAYSSWGASADGADIAFHVEGDDLETTVGSGWTAWGQVTAESDEIWVTVADVATATGGVQCDFLIRPAAPEADARLQPGDKIRVQKQAHRQGGHGRWRES